MNNTLYNLPYETYVTIGFFIFIVGLCIGSFLNVAALRGLTGESIVLPPSKCPSCKEKLKWYMNIPVVSYIFLLGSCYYCKKHISIQYPIVELSNGILYLALFLSFGPTIKTLFLCILASFLILITITDLKESVVLDFHTYPIIILGLLYNALNIGPIGWLESILGIIAGLLFFEITARLGHLFANSRAFGEGDTLIAMGIGAFFGWKVLLVIIFLSIIMQALFTLPILAIKSFKEKNYKMVSALITVIICIFAVEIFKILNLYENNIFLVLAMLLAIAVVLIWCLKVILADLKNKKETDNYLYMPFGPALVVATILMLFFQSPIQIYFKNLLGIG